jgi:acetyl esterase
MRVSRAGGAILLAVVLISMLMAGPASAQVDRLPPYLQETLAQIGPVFQRDIATSIPATLAAFQSILRSAPKDGVTVTADQHYGPDQKQVLDVYQPTPRQGAPILIYVHGSAYVTGDKNAYGEVYANIGWWFARQGIVTLNATYRLAPGSSWPGAVQDVRSMVTWARENAARLGADPNRIFLMGHSAGATHVASYMFDKALQPAEGPSIAGAVLISGRYRLEYDPADPNSRNMQAYFGDDPAQYPNRSPITHIGDSAKMPVFLVIAEYDNPGLDVRGAELLTALCQRDGTCPRFLRLAGHNHLSEVAAFNTPDEQLGREVLDFMRRGR